MSRVNLRYLVTIELTSGTITCSSEHLYLSGTEYERLLLNEPEIRQRPNGGLVLPDDVTIEIEDKRSLFSAKLRNGEEFRKRPIKVERYDMEADSTTTLLYANIRDIKIKGKRVTFDTAVIDDEILSKLLPDKVYTSDDWRTVADGAPRAINDTTIKNPEADQGLPYPIKWGHARRVKALYVFRDTVNDEYYYIFNRGQIEATDTDRDTETGKITVYANQVVVDKDQYTVGDGSQASPFPGYAYVKFESEQRDVNGNLLEVTVDFYASKFGGATAERNVANVIKYLLSDSTIGLGETVNADSFTAAATHLSSIYTDGGPEREQRSARDILFGDGGLAYCALGSIVRKNTDNEWEILIDEAQGSDDGTFANGFQATQEAMLWDTGEPMTWDSGGIMVWNPPGSWVKRNITDEPEMYSDTSGATSELTLKYRYNAWEQEYPLEIKRTVNAGVGEPRTIKLPYIRNSNSADRIAYYWQRREQLSTPTVTIQTNEDGQDIDLLDRVASKWQWREDGILFTHHDDTYLVDAKSGKTPEYSFDLRRYNDLLYSYVAGTIPTDPVDDTGVDYSSTPPDAPASITVVSCVAVQSSDGTTTVRLILSAPEIATNFAYMEFGYKQKALDNYQWVTGQGSAGTWVGTVEGALIPGQLYYYAARGVNQYGRTGVLREATNSGNGYTAPGDTTSPSKATGVSATARTGKSVDVRWTISSDKDRRESWLYRYTSNTPASALAAGPIYKGNSSKYVDENVAYGSTYYYWVVETDFSGNPNPDANHIPQPATTDFSDVSNDVTVAQVADGDLAGISTNKLIGTIVNAQLASGINFAKITSVVITNAMIDSVAAEKITTGSITGATITIDATSQIVVSANNGILVRDGSDILMQASSGNTSLIKFQSGYSRTTLIGSVYDSSTLYIAPENNGYCTLALGTVANTWNTIYGRAKSIYLNATTDSIFSVGGILQLTAGTAISLGAATNYTLVLSSSGFYPSNNLLDLGIAGAPFAKLRLGSSTTSYFTVEKVYALGAHSLQFTSTENANFCMRIDSTNGIIWISTDYTAGTPTWTEH